MSDSGKAILSQRININFKIVSPEEPRFKRSRRDTSYKSKASNKFKELKSGKKNKYEIEELESVYEVVEEKEYVKRVLNRQDDDWIVDDGKA